MVTKWNALTCKSWALSGCSQWCTKLRFPSAEICTQPILGPLKRGKNVKCRFKILQCWMSTLKWGFRVSGWNAHIFCFLKVECRVSGLFLNVGCRPIFYPNVGCWIKKIGNVGCRKIPLYGCWYWAGRILSYIRECSFITGGGGWVEKWGVYEKFWR